MIPVLSRMLTESWSGTSVLYVCPIKALLNNLEPRLSYYAGLVGRTVEVWHGDVSQSRKNRALRSAPDILLTTPESLEGMLISVRVNRPVWFNSLRTMIVDELHAFAADDRGWHLRSILHRLDRYLPQPAQRLGLSATVGNPDSLLEWFAPYGEKRVVGSASVSTDADVTIDHVSSLENAATVISRLHRGEKRLVFCDSRSGAEQLCSLLRENSVRTFLSHASLSAGERRQAETAFSEEKDCVIVATSTLELGIDVGDLDRVIQIDAPSSVSSFLQRMGRSGRRSNARRNYLFLTTNDSAFLLSLGLTRKWANAWVEAAIPPSEPWPILAQQALVSVLEAGEVGTSELVQRMHGSFPELGRSDISAIVSYLIQERFFHLAEGVVSVGERTEADFGRAHYRDLLASFSGSSLLTGRHGSAEIGYIDPSVLAVRADEHLILLGGRSWRVTEIEWGKRIAWLEPAGNGGKARWMGSARCLGREVCLGIREVLALGVPSIITLSQRAQLAFQRLVAETPVPDEANSVFSRDEDGGGRTWTFAGTRANRALARVSRSGNTKIRFDALSVQSAIPESGVIPADLQTITHEELAEFRSAIKFSGCLPASFLVRHVVVRYFEAFP